MSYSILTHRLFLVKLNGFLNQTSAPLIFREESPMFNYPYLIEILTPKKEAFEGIEEKMAVFADKYRKIVQSGCGVSIPDNPMGQPRYSAIEAIEFCGLPIVPERTVMNLNTFHTKDQLDALLKGASNLGLRYLLVVRGDGGPALPKLNPESIGGKKNIATSMDLIGHINKVFSGLFITGAAFNQYNRVPFETDRLRQKIDAGAKFIITQPVIGKDPNVDLLQGFDIPVVIEAWMSQNVELLYKSVRRQKEEGAEAYDPVKNLKILHDAYPENCVYLSLLSFKKDWKPILPRLPLA